MADENTETTGTKTSEGDGKNTVPGAGGGTQTSTRTTEGGGRRVSFDEEQQEVITRIVGNAVAKARRQWQRELQREQLDAASDEGDEGGDTQRGRKPAAPASQKSAAERQVEELTRQLRERDAKEAFVKAAGTDDVKAVDPDALFELVKSQLKYDDKTGAASNITDVIKSAQTTYPRQFGKAVVKAQTGVKPKVGNGASDQSDKPEVKPGLDRLRSAYSGSAEK